MERFVCDIDKSQKLLIGQLLKRCYRMIIKLSLKRNCSMTMIESNIIMKLPALLVEEMMKYSRKMCLRRKLNFHRIKFSSVLVLRRKFITYLIHFSK